MNHTYTLVDSLCYHSLPTLDECRQFLETINAGRVAAGLEPVEKLEYDECHPGSADSCLSAYHLFSAQPKSHAIGSSTVLCSPVTEPELAAGVRQRDGAIPDAILKVTLAFDRETPGLRDRLVEAGVVDA
jgi:hypothetical protein